MWYLRYIRALVPRIPREELTLGSLYHALHEGVPEQDLAAMSEEHARLLPEAKRLFEERTTKGAPMAEAVAKEESKTITQGPLANLYSCRFDRRERDTVREFKTAKMLWETNADYWQVNGEIVGQLCAMQDAGIPNPKVTVDIITKQRLPEKAQLEVKLTGKKRARFEKMITHAWADLQARLSAWLRVPDPRQANIEQHEENIFPAQLDSCIRYGQKCDFYDLCWGEDRRAQLNFREEPLNKRWEKFLLPEGNTNGESAAKAGSKAKPAAPKRTRRK